MRGQLTTVALISVACAALASCTSAGSDPTTGGELASTPPIVATPTDRETSPTEATSSPPTTPDPRTAPALAAYLHFARAVVAAERRPPALGLKTPPGADFGRWSYDPFKETIGGYIAGLAQQGLAFRGVPARHRVRVRRIDLAAKPYARVVLSDCPTISPSWNEYVVATGRILPDAKTAVKPPYRIAVTMIRVAGRWGVSHAVPNTSQTCTG